MGSFESHPKIQRATVVFQVCCGEIALEEKDYQAAADYYQSALKLDIKSTRALFGLGKSFYHLGETAKALRCFETLIKIEDSHQHRVWLGATLIAEGKQKAARELLRSLPNLEAALFSEKLTLARS